MASVMVVVVEMALGQTRVSNEVSLECFSLKIF